MTADLYHYRLSGLDSVWLDGGVTVWPDGGGEGVAFSDIDGLHREIGAALVRGAAPLKGPEIRFLRTEMGHSRGAFARLLRLSASLFKAAEPTEDGVFVGEAGRRDEWVRALYTQHLMECGFWTGGRLPGWKWWLYPLDTTRLVFRHGEGGWRLVGHEVDHG